MNQLQSSPDPAPRLSQTRNTLGSTRDLVSLLFRRKMIFLVVLVTISAASMFSLMNQQVVFVSQARVLLTRGAGASKGPDPRPVLNWWEEMRTAVEIARSRAVAELAAQELAREDAARLASEASDLGGVPVAPPSPESILGAMSVEPIEETDVIRLTYHALTARDAIRGVNAVTDAFLAYDKEMARNQAASQALAEAVEVAERRVDELTAEIAVYKTQHGITDSSTEAIELARQRKGVENKMIELRAKREAQETDLRNIERSLAEDPNVLVPSEEIARDPTVLTYTRRLAYLQAQLNTLLATYTRDNPQVRAVERDRQACVTSIREQVELHLAAKRNTIARLHGEEDAYRGQLAAVDAKLAKFTEHEARLEELRIDKKNATDHLAEVSMKHAQTRLDEDVDPRVGRLKTIAYAVSASRVGGGARKQLFLVFAVVLAVGLAFVAAFVVDTLDHSIKFPTDIEDALGVPVLASIREVRGSWRPEPDARETGA